MSLEQRSLPSGTSEVASVSSEQPPRALKAEDVQTLFQKRPALKAKLDAVYQSTRVQIRDTAENGRWRDHRNGTSSEERAFSRGMQLLKQSLNEVANNEDFAAFAAYVNALANPSA